MTPPEFAETRVDDMARIDAAARLIHDFMFEGEFALDVVGSVLDALGFDGEGAA
jgi:hypothetical protein